MAERVPVVEAVVISDSFRDTLAALVAEAGAGSTSGRARAEPRPSHRRRCS